MSRSSHATDHLSHTAPETIGVVIAPAKTSPNNGRTNEGPSRPVTASSQTKGFSRPMAAVEPYADYATTARHGPTPAYSNSPVARRSTGIHSILNPSSDVTHISPQTWAASSEHREVIVGDRVPAPSLVSPRIRKRGDSRSPVRGPEISQITGRPGRRMLTPKSPGLRAVSVGNHTSASTATGVSTQTSQRYNDIHKYSAEVDDRRDSIVPPLPPMPTFRTGFPAMQVSKDDVGKFPQPPLGSGTMCMAGSTISSHALSSNTPHPPFAPQISKPPPYQQSPGLPPRLESPVTKSEFPSGFVAGQTPSARQGEHYTQQGWMLALEGGDVGVHVDNQQASKMADEKRKRNAGASARFRARRKEREKEASQTISGLQQELREMAEDKNFYVIERNFFRDLFVRHNPGPLPLRPPSPQIRRVHGLVSAGHDSDVSSDYGGRESTQTPDQRHRTIEHQQPSFAASAPSTMPYQTSYAPYPYNQPGPGISQDLGAGSPSATQLPPPRAAFRDPFQRNILDRNWNAGK